MLEPSVTRSRSTPTRSSSAIARRSGWPIVIFSRARRRSSAARRRRRRGCARRRVVQRRLAAVGPPPLTCIRRGRSARADATTPRAGPRCPTPRRPPRTSRPARSGCGTGSAPDPGAGTPRTCTVSSTVGTHPCGRSRLNTAGGNASATSSSAKRVDRPTVGEGEPAPHLAPPVAHAVLEPGVVRVQPHVEPLHQRRRRPCRSPRSRGAHSSIGGSSRRSTAW